ncbi:hypothetical protein EBZ80_11280 [bacterium]|nr:hypothetical protein [bacterium]
MCHEAFADAGAELEVHGQWIPDGLLALFLLERGLRGEFADVGGEFWILAQPRLGQRRLGDHPASSLAGIAKVPGVDGEGKGHL